MKRIDDLHSFHVYVGSKQIKALTIFRGCAGSSEHSLLAYALMNGLIS